MFSRLELDSAKVSSFIVALSPTQPPAPAGAGQPLPGQGEPAPARLPAARISCRPSCSCARRAQAVRGGAAAGPAARGHPRVRGGAARGQQPAQLRVQVSQERPELVMKHYQSE